MATSASSSEMNVTLAPSSTPRGAVAVAPVDVRSISAPASTSAAAIAARESAPTRRDSIVQTSANATSTPCAATETVDHPVSRATVDQANSTIDAATADAPCSVGVRTAIDAVLAPSTMTASAPNSGHGGNDHSREMATV